MSFCIGVVSRAGLYKPDSGRVISRAGLYRPGSGGVISRTKLCRPGSGGVVSRAGLYRPSSGQNLIKAFVLKIFLQATLTFGLFGPGFSDFNQIQLRADIFGSGRVWT